MTSGIQTTVKTAFAQLAYLRVWQPSASAPKLGLARRFLCLWRNQKWTAAAKILSLLVASSVTGNRSHYEIENT